MGVMGSEMTKYHWLSWLELAGDQICGSCSQREILLKAIFSLCSLGEDKSQLGDLLVSVV